MLVLMQSVMICGRFWVQISIVCNLLFSGLLKFISMQLFFFGYMLFSCIWIWLRVISGLVLSNCFGLMLNVMFLLKEVMIWVNSLVQVLVWNSMIFGRLLIIIYLLSGIGKLLLQLMFGLVVRNFVGLVQVWVVLLVICWIFLVFMQLVLMRVISLFRVFFMGSFRVDEMEWVGFVGVVG